MTKKLGHVTTGLKEVFDSDGSVLGYSRSESTEYVKIEDVNKMEQTDMKTWDLLIGLEEVKDQTGSTIE